MPSVEQVAEMVWTISDIPKQDERVILITGATSGTGYESARVLAERGAHLVLACRNKEKMSKVADECRAAGAKSVDELLLDTSNLDSVRACAESYNGPPLDVLLLNAGTGEPTEFKTTPQGYEYTFAANQLGHWLLTGLLLEKVKGRIVVVSSLAHKAVKDINWKCVEGDSSTWKKDMYSQSKFANMVFVEELNRRLSQVDSEVIAVGCHPGVANTDIVDKIENPPFIVKIFKFAISMLGQTAAEGAWPLIRAATEENINRNMYFAPAKGVLMLGEMYGPPISNGKKSDSVSNEDLAKKMWEESERLCDYKYSF